MCNIFVIDYIYLYACIIYNMYMCTCNVCMHICVYYIIYITYMQGERQRVPMCWLTLQMLLNGRIGQIKVREIRLRNQYKSSTWVAGIQMLEPLLTVSQSLHWQEDGSGYHTQVLRCVNGHVNDQSGPPTTVDLDLKNDCFYSLSLTSP